eukprot:2382643-Rhodomonas_salina.4
MSTPSSRILPPDGSYSRVTSDAVVLFPLPLAPHSANTSPRCSDRLTPRRTSTCAPSRPPCVLSVCAAFAAPLCSGVAWNAVFLSLLAGNAFSGHANIAMRARHH